MSEMSPEQLKEALEHDAALRGAAVEIEGRYADVGETLVSLDAKIALLAKSVALVLIDSARTFTNLALTTGKTKTIANGPGQPLKYETEPPNPDVSIKMLIVAEKALSLARSADVMGDRAIVRIPEPQKDEAEDVKRNKE